MKTMAKQNRNPNGFGKVGLLATLALGGLVQAQCGATIEEAFSASSLESWCSGTSCANVTVDGMWQPGAKPAASALCVKINTQDPTNHFYKIPIPDAPSFVLRLPTKPDGSFQPVSDLLIRAIRDDQSGKNDDQICGQPSCLAATYQDVPQVTAAPATIIAELTKRQVEVKVNVAPEEVGQVTWLAAGTNATLDCRYSALADHKNCTQTVDACSEVELTAHDLGNGTFAGWSTGSDRSCASNLNPLRMIAGMEPGGTAAGVSLDSYCGLGDMKDAVIAQYTQDKCGPRPQDDRCYTCNPIEALDPGEGTNVCNSAGQWECRDVVRKTVVLNGNDPWLKHDYGRANGTEWSGQFTSNKGPFILQKGPGMTLPPGRYYAEVSAYARSLYTSSYPIQANMNLQVVDHENGTTVSVSGSTGSAAADQSGHEVEIDRVYFLITSGCHKMDFNISADSICSYSIDENIFIRSIKIVPL